MISENAGIYRFSSDAKLARLAGSAPIPASSGRTDRHRLAKGGNRQLRAYADPRPCRWAWSGGHERAWGLRPAEEMTLEPVTRCLTSGDLRGDVVELGFADRPCLRL
jgi:hypothetical protein